MANFATSREFFNAIITGVTITEDMVEYAKSAIEKMDTKNEHKRLTKSPVQLANDTIKTQILEFMGENGKVSAKMLADNFSLSTQKISALMKQMVDDGRITVVKDKFEGSSSKVNVYSLVEVPTEDVDDNDDYDNGGDDNDGYDNGDDDNVDSE